MNGLSLYLTIYGFLAIGHIILQVILGHSEHKKQESKKFKRYHENHFPSITVVVPVYNEDPSAIAKNLNSIANQDYPDYDVIVVDDGSKNKEEIEKVFNEFKDNKKFKFLTNSKNLGKRNSQKRAFDIIKNELIVTVDSDTFIEAPYGLLHIAKQFKDPSVGAVTGDVRVANKNTNLLTRLISYRYWTAFHQERAAQGLFNVVMCCSGPFSAYRRSVIEIVKNKYVSQRFLGKTCTFGDDRHLTNLVLEEGHKVKFDKRAVAYTNVPENFAIYSKQQVRWNKSFYREILWTVKFGHKHHFYLMLDLIFQTILPAMLLFALVAMIYQAITIDINLLFKYFFVLIGIALLRSLYGIYRTKDIGFLVFIVYGFIHVFALIPIRLYALMTINKTKWGTR